MKLPESEAENEGPNLTPVIDIVFLLLIFFLVATRFDEQEKSLSLKLAEVLQAQPMVGGAKEVVVNVTKKGEYVVMEEKFNEKTLIALLEKTAALNPRTHVQIRADQDVRLLFPLTVVGICKSNKLDYSCTVLQKRPA